jgi:lipopolysaccharide biosynthesis glycosyltransferase
MNNETTEILVMTSLLFQPLIQFFLSKYKLPINYYILNLNTLFEAGCARLHVFQWKKIDKYAKILYLDTDILINSDINVLFNLEIVPSKVYALEEGLISNESNFYGSEFFDFTKYDKNQTAFTSGILYFYNSVEIKQLFQDITNHIKTHIYINKNSIPSCLDQPFIVYNAIVQNKYDNQLLKEYAENNPLDVNNKKIIYHFPGGPGCYEDKNYKMKVFWEKIDLFWTNI